MSARTRPSPSVRSLHACNSNAHLRSSVTLERSLSIPRTKTKTIGPRGFYFASSAAWNKLPGHHARLWTSAVQLQHWKTHFFPEPHLGYIYHIICRDLEQDLIEILTEIVNEKNPHWQSQWESQCCLSQDLDFWWGSWWGSWLLMRFLMRFLILNEVLAQDLIEILILEQSHRDSQWEKKFHKGLRGINAHSVSPQPAS